MQPGASPAHEPGTMMLRGSLITVIALVASIGLGIGAQFALNARHVPPGIIGYGVAVGVAVIGVSHIRVLPYQPAPVPIQSHPTPWSWRLSLVVLALIAGTNTFALSSGNRYRPAGVVLWLISILCWWLAWADTRWFTALKIQLTARRLALLAAIMTILLLGAVFRFAHLTSNPAEMGSDHVEKLLDVHDILSGSPSIFFERNTGREPWQFYWTVMLVRLTGIAPDFMALKLGTALIGWLMLPAVFLLAREVAGSRVALLAMLLAAITSWAVIPARFGLRYPLAPCAVAWTMFFLVRGLRRNERTAMLAAGVWIGIGLQGYTAYRLLPAIVLLLLLLWIIGYAVQHRYALAAQTALHGGLALVMAVLVMLPLLHYAYERPDRFFYRMTTRLTSHERAIEGEIGPILLNNLKEVLLFFNYTTDRVPVVNILSMPALDLVLGALLVIGMAAILTLTVRRHNPWLLVVAGTGILMLLPSALSLAFPLENPSTVRTGGAIPLLMIVCALPPGLLLEAGSRVQLRMLRGAVLLAVVVLVLAAIQLNADRVFRQYPAQYCRVAPNASDVARELHAFVAAGHSRDAAWIVGYPHWIDYRAVGVWIGDIRFANHVFGAEEALQIEPGDQPVWFALHAHDGATQQALWTRYPHGMARTVRGSHCPDQQFVVFTTAIQH